MEDYIETSIMLQYSYIVIDMNDNIILYFHFKK